MKVIKSYNVYKEDFSDREWWDLLKMANLYPQFVDMFDRNGEVGEEYEDSFNVSVFVLSHESIRISDYETMEKFFLNYARTYNEMDEDIKEFIFKHTNGTSRHFQISGDGDGLGFIVDIFEDEDMDEAIETMTVWFEDYE